ncbi:hypothetical protein EVA_11786 [gut metagenome]|uniref:Uncharacterized protein n=1 Tax=gut metagenome TaxID=749906 RepID=J9FYS2_9ZZZZ
MDSSFKISCQSVVKSSGSWIFTLAFFKFLTKIFLISTTAPIFCSISSL